MTGAFAHKLIAHISRKKWWHGPPRDPVAYKRGKFFAVSSLRRSKDGLLLFPANDPKVVSSNLTRNHPNDAYFAKNVEAAFVFGDTHNLKG
jgi:hypothetical protein